MRYRLRLFCVLAAHWLSPRSRPHPLRVLFLSDLRAYLTERQFSPFYCFRGALARRLGFVFRPMRLDPENLPGRSALSEFDIVVFKLNYKTPPADAVRIAADIAAAKRPGAKLVYFDGNDDICIQWPGILKHVDLYVKRHVFRDRSKYLGRFTGSINLTDYVSRTYGSAAIDGDTSTSEPVRPEDLAKIHCGMSFGMDEIMLELRKKIAPPAGPRPNDVVCRANVPDNWMGYLRRPVGPALARMAAAGWKVLTPDQRVPQEVYYEEMASSKSCISPLGYGEICYRDYESAIFGCLLVKPDMSHVEALPDIFRAGETYVPVAWDYSDLEEKLGPVLRDPAAAARMTSAAAAVLDEAHTEDWFIDRVHDMLKKAGI